MLLDIKSVRVNPGASLPFSYSLDLSALDFFGETLLKRPVQVEGEIRNRAGMLECRATVQAEVDTLCARCLTPLRVPVTVQIRQPLDEDLQDEENDEILPIVGGQVDMDDIATQALVLRLDRVYLCSPDCKGLCPHCGANLNDGPCACENGAVHE